MEDLPVILFSSLHIWLSNKKLININKKKKPEGKGLQRCLSVRDREAGVMFCSVGGYEMVLLWHLGEQELDLITSGCYLLWYYTKIRPCGGRICANIICYWKQFSKVGICILILCTIKRVSETQQLFQQHTNCWATKPRGSRLPGYRTLKTEQYSVFRG